ncbi:hypothetical protein OF897_21460, partial [Chryseobacterium formosus]
EGGPGGGGNTDPGTPSDNCSSAATNPGEVGLINENGCNTGLPTETNIRPTQTPCADLNAKSINNDFLGKMQELSNNANGSVEAGITMYNTSPSYSNKKYGGVDSEGNSFVNLEADLTRAPDITGFMHCHLNILTIPDLRTLTVFSMSDFVVLAELVKDSTVPVNKLGMYVTSDRGTFAIKLTNKQAIIDFANYIKTNHDYVNTLYENKIVYSMTKKQQVKGLLELIKDSGVGSGIELYESDSDFKNWKKHYLDEDGKLKDQKCN